MTAVVADWQAEIGGLLLGPGTPYELLPGALTGLLDLPSVRTRDAERANADGVHTGTDHVGAAMIELGVDVVRTPTVPFAQAVAELMAATVHGGDRDLYWKVPGLPVLRRTVRVRKRALPLPRSYEFGLGTAVLGLLAPDPRAYGPVVSVSTGLPTSGGGLTYPLTYPLSYGALGASGQVLLTNSGWADADPVFDVRGPLPAGFEVSSPLGRLRYGTAVPDGQTVHMEAATGQVTVDGGADRTAQLTVRDWFPVPALSSVLVQFTSLAGSSPAALLTASSAPAYL